MAKTTTSPLPDRLAAIRQQITETRAARHRITAQRRSRDEVSVYLMQRIDEWERIGDNEVAQAVQDCAKGQPVDFFMISGTGRQTLGPLFASIAGEALRAAVDRQVQTLPMGMSATQRAAEMEKQSARLRELETEEELLIRESEAANDPIDRRPDADPAIVLFKQLR